MEKTTQVLNVFTLIMIVMTGLYIHIRFDQILNSFSLILLWVSITFLIGMHLEYTFEIIKRINVRVVK